MLVLCSSLQVTKRVVVAVVPSGRWVEGRRKSEDGEIWEVTDLTCLEIESSAQVDVAVRLKVVPRFPQTALNCVWLAVFVSLRYVPSLYPVRFSVMKRNNVARLKQKGNFESIR
jgi:hypothetical protein